MGQVINAYSILVRKVLLCIQLERPECTLEDNIKVNLNEIEREIEDWIKLARDMFQWWDFMNTVINT
jgi:hypothetical protein